MKSENSSKRDRIDALLHGSIEHEQLVLLESETVGDAIGEDHESYASIAKSLKNIRNSVVQNSAKMREAMTLIREMN